MSLHRATTPGYASALLLQGAPLEARNDRGLTPLMAVAQNQFANDAVLDVLLAAGADVESATAEGATAFHFAVASRKYWVAHRLIHEGLRGSPYRVPGALHEVCARDHPSLLEYLVCELGYSVEAVWEKNGATPLHMACSSANANAVSVLLRFGANPRVRDASGATPLTRACLSMWWTRCKDRGRQVQIIVDLLNAAGADLCEDDATYGNAAICTATAGHWDICLKLLRMGVPLESELRRSHVIHAAVSVTNRYNSISDEGDSERIAFIREIIELHGADPDCEDRSGWTPCFIAAIEGDWNMVMFLLDFDVRTTLFGSLQLYHFAMQESTPSDETLASLVMHLHETGESLNMPNFSDKHLIIHAISTGMTQTAHALLYLGCDVCVVDSDGLTAPLAISIAAERGMIKPTDAESLLRTVLDMGASPDIPDQNARTAVGVALLAGITCLIPLLMRQGAMACTTTMHGTLRMLHCMQAEKIECDEKIDRGVHRLLAGLKRTL